MNDELRKSFENLLKNGEYSEAEKQLNEFIKLHPEDWEAKMLSCTCRMLQGDTETARQVRGSRNKPGESVFHAVVSVFVYFLFYPLLMFVFFAPAEMVLIPRKTYAGIFASWLISLMVPVLYSILTINLFRAGNENAD